MIELLVALAIGLAVGTLLTNVTSLARLPELGDE